MIEVREVLRGWLGGAGLRTVAARAGVDRKTARRYVQAAQEAGLVRSAHPAAVDDALIGAVLEVVRPARPNGHGSSWELLLAHEEAITAWVKGDGKDARPLSIVKIEELLTRQGVVVPDAAGGTSYGCPGAWLIVSDAAADVLPGATLDYSRRLKPPRFRILGNPNTGHVCPCRRSFGEPWPGPRQPTCRSYQPMPWDTTYDPPGDWKRRTGYRAPEKRAAEE